MVSEAHKIPILSCDPCLFGRQKNSKCSGLDPIFSHIVFLVTFFFTIKQSPSRELRSNNEYCLRKKPLMSLPTSRSPKQHFKVSTGPALNRAVHMKARVSSDDVQVSHSLKAKAHAVFPWPCRFCDYWSRFIFRSWQNVNMVFFTLLYIMLSWILRDILGCQERIILMNPILRHGLPKC